MTSTKEVKISLFVLILISLGMLSCHQALSELSSREIHSSVITQDKSDWKLETAEIGKSENISSFCSYDENLIYGISVGKSEFTLYKTVNGGKDWEKLETIADYYINDIFFISPNEGFIAATKLHPLSSIDENGSSILKTSDGGKTWENVFSSESDIVRKFGFNSDRNTGMVVGSKRGENKYFSVNLVLLTKDKGKTWVDVSDNLNYDSIALNSAGRIDDSLRNILFTNNIEIYCLSVARRIYKTSDEGKTWSLYSQLVDEPAQTSVHRFGILNSGNLWLGGGTISIEGKWSMVAVMNNRFGWDTYRLPDYFFSDIEFLSNNEVMAVGSIVAPNNFGGNSDSNRGIILYSKDSGKTWISIHEGNTSRNFNSIIKLPQQKLLITGNNGDGILLERISNQ